MYQPLNGMAVNCSPPQSKAMLDTAGNAYQRKSNSSNQSYLPKWNWNEDLDQSNEFSPSSLFFRSIEYFSTCQSWKCHNVPTTFPFIFNQDFPISLQKSVEIFFFPLSPLSLIFLDIFIFVPLFQEMGKRKVTRIELRWVMEWHFENEFRRKREDFRIRPVASLKDQR